ncbi:MAG: response regulator [Bryobacteraceae bacterium]
MAMADAPRILVVDDDAAVRRLFETVLSEDGYYVTVAASGREAVAALHNTVFDVIVLDMSLRDMDGLGLLREIRVEFPLSRALATSGFMESPRKGLARRAGAAAILAKPIRASILQAAVYGLLDPSGSCQSTDPAGPAD